jgi:NADH:ubiquinone reductase (H+-translocating)
MTTAPTAACPPTDAERRIIIIGGGYAGTTLAVRLGRALKRHPRPGVEVLLLETSPCQQALSELDLVAAGPERPEFCELWLPAVLKDLPVRTCFNRAESIDCNRRVVTIKGGQEVEYWRLVVATGAVPSIPPVPGLADHAITMWSVADAQKLQSRVREQMKLAAAMPYAEQRRKALSVTVCGGGATGVEIVGTLGQLLPKRAAAVGLDPSDLNIHLIEGRPDILYDLPEAQRRKATQRLAKLGVEIVTGSMVASIEDAHVKLADGREVPSAVLVWCGGARSDPHASVWGFTLDNGGRIVTGPDGKADGLDDVYALGDVASFRDPRTKGVLPMLAQFAITSAEHASGNVLAEIDGRPTTPFTPNQHGEFVSVGPSWGVGWMFGLKLSGFPAIFMKRLTYVLYWWQVGGLSLAWKRGRELLAMQR